MAGRFITLEGSEGAGKSTNLDLVCTVLAEHGVAVLKTREPGGTPVAEALRDIMLGDWQEDVAGLTELLLVFAARNQHLNDVIRPALAAGTWVVCDRFTDATYAYQGAARGIDTARIAVLEEWVHGDLQPDLTVYLDVPNDLSVSRIADRPKDRMEREDGEFFAAVRAGYQERAAVLQRFATVDASRPLDEVQLDVRAVIATFLAGSVQ